MKGSSPWPVTKNTTDKNNQNRGWYVASGNYIAQLYRVEGQNISSLGNRVEVNLKPLKKSTLTPQSIVNQKVFANQYMDAQVRRSILFKRYNEVQNKAKALLVATKKGSSPLSTVIKPLQIINDSIIELKTSLYGNEAKKAVGEKTYPTLNDRMNAAGASLWGSSYGPTQTSKNSLAIANELMKIYEDKIADLNTHLKKQYEELLDAGAPVILEMVD
jgi:hypothetical protein